MTDLTAQQSSAPQEYVDPQEAPRRLDRRTIVTLAISTITLLVVAVIFANSRDARDAPTRGTTAGFAGPLPGLEALSPPTLPQAPPPSWGEGVQPVNVEVEPEEDPRRAVFEEARHGGGIIFQSGGEGDADGEASSTGAPSAEPGSLVLLEGTVMEAVLESPLSSDRPGPVTARVLSPVMDSKTLTQTLVPVGTRVLGQVGSVASRHSGGILVSWHRLVFPDGSTRDLPALPGLSPEGLSGLDGNIDRHRSARFGRTALTAIIGGVTSYSAAQLGPTGLLLGGGIGLQVGNIAQSELQTGGRRAPTVTVEAGHRFLIHVQEDLHLPPR